MKPLIKWRINESLTKMGLLTKLTFFLNKCFDFGEKPLSNAGGLVVMVGAIMVITLLIILTVVGGPERLPGT